MTTEIFTVFDQAAARYMDPFPAPTIEFALRGFRQACLEPEHQFAKFPEDYALYHVGSFDGELGVIKSITGHKIANASSMIGPQIDLEEHTG